MFSFAAFAPALNALCVRYGVARLVAFGSALRYDFHSGSDIDLLVRFDRARETASPESDAPAARDLFTRWMDLQTELEALFQKKVDLLPEEGLRNPYLLAEIKRQNLELYPENRRKQLSLSKFISIFVA